MYYNQQGFGYNNPFNEFMAAKRDEKRKLSTVSMAVGGALIGFVAIGLASSFVLSLSDSFVRLYNNNSAFEQSFTSILTLISIVIPFYAAYSSLKSKRLVGEIPFDKPKNKTDAALLVPVCIMICILGSFLTSFLSSFADAWFGIEFSQPEDDGVYTTVSGVLMSVLFTAVVPAFTEEFAIRGVVLQALRRYGDGFAVIMSAFVFAIMHGNMVQIPFAFVAGIALGYAAIKTGSLWTGILIHFLNNFIAIVSTVLLDSLSETAGTIVIYLIYIAVFVAGGICAAKYIKRNRDFTSCLGKGQYRCLTASQKTAAFIFTVPMIIAIAFMVYETSLYISA